MNNYQFELHNRINKCCPSDFIINYNAWVSVYNGLNPITNVRVYIFFTLIEDLIR